MRSERRAAAESAAHSVALPVHVAGEVEVAGVIGLLAVLRVGAVGVVLRLRLTGELGRSWGMKRGGGMGGGKRGRKWRWRWKKGEGDNERSSGSKTEFQRRYNLINRPSPWRVSRGGRRLRGSREILGLL